MIKELVSLDELLLKKIYTLRMNQIVRRIMLSLKNLSIARTN